MIGMLAFGLVLGCGGEAEEPAGDCAERAGTYVITFDERSGTCGPIPETIFSPSDAQMASETCAFDGTVSDNNCEVTSSAVCEEPGIGPGVYSESDTIVSWNRSGTSGGGIFEMTVRNPNETVLCRSTYDVSYTRQ